MKKKLVSLLLVAVMALSVCACGAEKKQESSAPAASKSEAPAASSSAAASSEATAEEYVPTYPIVDEPITVKGVVVSRSTEKRSDRLVWNKVSEVTGINIEWEVIDSESLATYMAGNDWPDFFQHGFSTSMVNDYGVTGGRFVNFNDYLDIMPNLVQTMEDYPISRGAITEVNGEIYRLPYVEVAATSTGNNRPYLRTDVLEAAGLKMPTTIDEFYNCLKVLKDKNGVASFIPSLTTYWGPILFAAFGTETELNLMQALTTRFTPTTLPSR